MSVALALSNAAQGRLNAHIAIAALIALATAMTLALIALLGDPDQARHVARARVADLAHDAAPPSPIPADPSAPPGHAAAHGAPALLRPEAEDAHAPRLPGVVDLSDHGAPPPARDAHAAAPATPSPAPRGEALPRAPIDALTAPGPGGLLPAIGADGTRPLDAYARPFDADDARPRIAVIIGGLGLSRAATEAAINELPPEVTLGFAPYADDLQHWIDAARAAGHEVVLELPMEPFDYPANDPGPHTLLANAERGENARRLDWLMTRATGYFAVMNYLGARFTSSETALSPVLTRVGGRGVGFIYDGEAPRPELADVASRLEAPFAQADRVLDARPSAIAIDEQLLHLEALALQNGYALGVGAAYPVTVGQVRAWARTLEHKGYALAPASAVLAAQTAAAAQTSHEVAAPPLAEHGVRNFETVRAGFGERASDDAADAGAGGHGGGHGGGGDSHGGGHH